MEILGKNPKKSSWKLPCYEMGELIYPECCVDWSKREELSKLSKNHDEVNYLNFENLVFKARLTNPYIYSRCGAIIDDAEDPDITYPMSHADLRILLSNIGQPPLSDWTKDGIEGIFTFYKQGSVINIQTYTGNIDDIL